jgi:hypothetical protein
VDCSKHQILYGTHAVKETRQSHHARTTESTIATPRALLRQKSKVPARGVPATPKVLSLRINTLNWILAASSEGRTWVQRQRDHTENVT